MYPPSGHRVISTKTDIIFENKQQYNYTRICLPGLNTGITTYISQFCDFYKCNFSKITFDNQVNIYKNEAISLFKANIEGTITNKSYLHRKIRLCNIGLKEDWHSPVFVIKINSNIIATTGHNKIYATALRKQNYNMDFDCFVFDFDRNPEGNFINIDDVLSDKDFSDKIGSNQFGIDISIEKTVGGYVPAIMQFSKYYPINYHDGSHELTDDNAKFFDMVSKNNKINITVQDSFKSHIFDSSGVFNIINEVSESLVTFVSNRRIRFDLSDLLPFFTINASVYTDINRNYSVFVDSQLPLEKLSCPSVLL